MDIKLIIFIITAIIYIALVPFKRNWDDDTETGWKTFIIKVLPTRIVILFILYLIIF